MKNYHFRQLNSNNLLAFQKKQGDLTVFLKLNICSLPDIIHIFRRFVYSNQPHCAHGSH